MRSWIILVAAVLALVGVGMVDVHAARADIVVNVDQGATQPLPIAIPAFSGPPVAAEVRKVIAADLARSGLFRPLDPADVPSPRRRT